MAATAEPTAEGLAAGAAESLNEEETPVFAKEAEIIAVPVFVTDRNGKAVGGLTRDDFVVRDEGKLVEVEAFLVIDAGATELLPATGPVAVVARRQFLLLFDLSFTTPEALHAAQLAALEFVAGSLGPNDLTGVATLGGGTLRSVVGFTSDCRQLTEGIATLGVTRGDRVRDPLGLAYDLQLDPLEPVGVHGLLIYDEEKWVRELLREYGLRGDYPQHVRDLLDGLDGLSTLLDSIRGRKQVIFFSAGFRPDNLTGVSGAKRVDQSRAVTEGRLWEAHSDQHFGDATTQAVFAELMERLRRTDTVLHTVDVMGLANRVTGVESQLPGPPESGRESLGHLAAGSGGIFVRETNDLSQALADVLAATRHYYVLGFEPAAGKREPGKLRRLKVEVDRGGVDVSHRRGYVLPDPDERPSESARHLRAAQLMALGVAGGDIRVSAVAVPYRCADGQPCLPVVVEVDGTSLLAGDGPQRRPLEVYVYAVDGDGRILDALGLRPVLELDEVGERVRARGLQILTSLRAMEGPTDVRVLVRDTETDRTGLFAKRVTVPAFSADRVYVTQPLLVEDPATRVAIPAASQAHPTPTIPFRIADRAFTLDATDRLRNGEAREVCVLFWSGKGGAAGTEARVVSRLVGPDGNYLLAASARTADDPDGFTRHVLDVIPRGVPTGDYELRVEVELPEGGTTHSSRLVHVE